MSRVAKYMISIGIEVLRTEYIEKVLKPESEDFVDFMAKELDITKDQAIVLNELALKLKREAK